MSANNKIKTNAKLIYTNENSILRICHVVKVFEKIYSPIPSHILFIMNQYYTSNELLVYFNSNVCILE